MMLLKAAMKHFKRPRIAQLLDDYCSICGWCNCTIYIAQTKCLVKYFDMVGLICLEVSPPQSLMEYEVNEESEPILIVAPLFTL